MSTKLLPEADEVDYNKGPTILGSCLAVTILAFIIVCARIWVRVKLVRHTGPDDYVILIAMLLSLVGISIVIPEVVNGAGRHLVYLDPAKAKIGLELNFITQPIYLLAITIVKCSIALFLLRIAPTKFYQNLLWGIITFLVVYTAACFMTLVLQCKNLAIIWDSTVKTTCWTPTTLRGLSFTNSSLNIFTDIVMAMLPIPMLWNVQISGRVKLSLIAIMSLGIFACAASIVKLSFISNYGKTGDFLWDSANLTIWTVIECNVGIVTACLPCLKPLFKILHESSWSASGTKSKNTKNTKNNELSLHTLPAGSHYQKFVIMSNNGFQNLETGKRRNSKGLDNLEDNRSEESILPLQGSSITKTTVVTVDTEIGSEMNEGEKERRQIWGKGSLKEPFAPERRVEDRI